MKSCAQRRFIHGASIYAMTPSLHFTGIHDHAVLSHRHQPSGKNKSGAYRFCNKHRLGRRLAHRPPAGQGGVGGGGLPWAPPRRPAEQQPAEHDLHGHLQLEQLADEAASAVRRQRWERAPACGVEREM